MKKSLLIESLQIARTYNKKHKEECRKKSFLHFTIIVQDEKILDWGVNRKGVTFTNLGYKNYQMLHSEIAAFFKAKGLLDRRKKWEAINIRLGRDESIRLSAPCKCCSAFMKSVGCEKIWFTTYAGWARITL